ncbi:MULTISPECIES: PQQ-dependent sugar dehydrogenase [Nitrosomonas]|uniref:CHRD domain-containing protein n=1 Tax=Nitrosomonas communis TaxID=44574 RepID=A0A0F7KFP1_9PROT|nr:MULTISPECIES: PQQ-dependent sugar dehydrogenase [Nitrosomonas]AKH39260.1 CHRD domain-containing protein [Nitrosomonas communis]TYP87363.1 glucose/sorbosone dehydrogenase [Nitrosomonas communis]UVS61467.1 PQQ-dependent sugar dehydrogenase [Nitrosomonas sp. PLL12]
MKIYYSILSLLLLIFISTKWSETNANPATSREPLTSASEQRLDDPILTPIQRGSIRLRLKQIASGLTAPNWATPAPNDPDHLYVSDQDGKLWRINLTTNDKEIFLDFSDLLVPLGVSGSNSFDERGFLGFAFHPQFVGNGLLYTYTSEPAGEKSDFSTIPPGASPNHRSVIREWRLDPNNFNQAQANVKEMRVLMTVDQPQFNHNAGALNFGSDGMLYIAFGDGGGADDRDGQDIGGSQMIGHGPNGNGQNTGNPLGKLLRIDPVGNNSNNGQYGIPNDNPFVGSDTALKEIYAYGFRNPFRFSFDPETNFLVLADVGQNDIEEINLVQAGRNYGWGLKEGSFRFEPNDNEPGFVTDAQIAGNFIDPVIQYDHSEGTAVIGGFIYRGKAIPALEGVYLFGDVARTGNGDGRIFYSNGSSILEMDLTEHAQPGFWVLGFGQDIDKELYVLGNMTGIPFETTGAVYKLVPNASFDSDVLEIPAVDVNFDNNHSGTFRARLQLVQDTQPPRFELTQTEQLADRFRGDNASFNQTTGELSIPFVNIRDTSDNISTFAAQLQLIPGLPVLTFELKQFVPVR